MQKSTQFTELFNSRMVVIRYRRSRTCWGLFVLLIIIIGALNLYKMYIGRGNIYLELTRNAIKDCKTPKNFTSLSHLKNDNAPQGEHNIFFVETWRGCNRMAHLTQRTACAVESAAKINTNWNIYLFFIDVIGYDEHVADLIDKLSLLANVQIIAISLEDLSKDTPLYDWVQAKHYEQSQYIVSHVSDLVRVLLLYKYAGTYMDTDIISLKPVAHLGRNYAVAQSYFEVVPGFMNFGSDNIGREMIQSIAGKFKFYWRPDDWSAQGPTLITDIMRKQCNTIFTYKMTEERCSGFRAISVNEVLAIDQSSQHYFFEAEYFSKGLKTIQNSTGTHLWNAFSGAKNVSKSTSNLINFLARQNCPNVFFNQEQFW